MTSDDVLNMYLILSGFALVNNQREIYCLCLPRLSGYNKSLGQWEEALLRTDEDIRQLLNLTLACAILTYELNQVELVLTWARQNTLIQQIDDEWI